MIILSPVKREYSPRGKKKKSLWGRVKSLHGRVIILSWRKRKYTPLGIQKILLGKRDSPWGRENSLSPGKRKSSLGKYRLSLGKKVFSPKEM
jgi:hypothetical protein